MENRLLTRDLSKVVLLGTGRRNEWNVGCACAVTVRDGREPVDVSAEQLGERCLLGFAQFRELLCHVRDRAVVLADLYAVADGPRRRGEPGVGEGVGDGVRGGFETLGALIGGGCHISDDRLDPPTGEFGDRGISPDLTELTHGGAREVVVGVTEPAAALGGDLEVLRGPSPSAVTHGDGGRLARLTGLEQCVEVSPDTGGAQTEPGADFRCRDGSLFEEEFHDGGARVSFVSDGNG